MNLCFFVIQNVLRNEGVLGPHALRYQWKAQQLCIMSVLMVMITTMMKFQITSSLPIRSGEVLRAELKKNWGGELPVVRSLSVCFR